MIRIFQDMESLSQAAAEQFTVMSRQSISICGRFSVALSGGSTPARLYQILADSPYRQRIHWEDVHVFWSDERYVPEDDPRSNALMSRRTLLDLVPIPPKNIHPIHCYQSPQKAALIYERELRDFFSSQNPNFHLVLLGLGEDGHTASLFPRTPVLNDKERWVAEVYIPELDMHRVTFTASFINQASQVVFLASGLDKADVLKKVLEGPYQPHELPAQLIRPNGAHPLWLVDKASSQKLTAQNTEEELYSEESIPD
jgi:6-phosphogluconolactonase